MRPVYIAGAGQTPVAEHWERSLERLGVEALRLAQAEAPAARIEALYVANALGGNVAGQSHLGAHLAAAACLGPIEAMRLEAAGASGGVALRQAYLAIATGVYDCVAVLGVEKVTDYLDAPIENALALSLDATLEAEQGLTLSAGWALLQHRYSFEYGYEPAAFAPFPVNAHANAVHNRNALYRFPIAAAKVAASAPVIGPLGMLDCSTVADGAAALILVADRLLPSLPHTPIRIAGSSVATAPLALASRPDPLSLDAAARSAEGALTQAGITRESIQVAEVSDQHGIVAALSLEASGFFAPGQAPRWAGDGAISPAGRLPLATFGGCKARGDTVGALGVYQVAELVVQLRGQAGPLQVPEVRTAFVQCLGGLGATAATHILIKD